MHIERSFAHILDAGGMRRTTLRGWENLNKRFKLAAAFYNLSQLMRKIFGFGTPKQLAAARNGAGGVLFSRWPSFFMTFCTMRVAITPLRTFQLLAARKSLVCVGPLPPLKNAITSTGC